MSGIHLLIADDHEVVAEGLAKCLGLYATFEQISYVANGIEALQYMQDQVPDVILVDINMPEMGGLRLLKAIKQQKIAVKPLMLSMHSSSEYVHKCTALGAKGYITKDVSSEEIEMAIKIIHKGGVYYSSSVAETALNQKNQFNSDITTQELIILKRIASGQTTKKIALEIKISPRTVETHRRNIRSKLGLNNTADMIKYAIENKLV
ncbi:MAG: response regulator transcription factor [Rhizobiales bacterium]|nr:response regulator transcription factor [Hyphomicrobiales bacterium]NRB14651.1 response regulator transcription factor [Hyphomicrobiales bacterium]